MKFRDKTKTAKQKKQKPKKQKDYILIFFYHLKTIKKTIKNRILDKN